MYQSVFISHSSRDRSLADAVCHGLEARGIKCWIAPRDIQVSEDWPSAIERGISNSNIMIVIISENSCASKDVANEVGIAHKAGIHIIQLRIDLSDLGGGLSYYLNNKQWIHSENPPSESDILYLTYAISEYIHSNSTANNGPVASLDTTKDQGSLYVSYVSGITLATIIPCPVWAFVALGDHLWQEFRVKIHMRDFVLGYYKNFISEKSILIDSGFGVPSKAKLYEFVNDYGYIHSEEHGRYFEANGLTYENKRISVRLKIGLGLNS